MVFAFIFSDAGIGEWLVLLAVLLIVEGPQRLPETARRLGRWYSQLRRAAEGFRRQLMEAELAVEREAESQTKLVEGAFASVGDEAAAKPATVAEA